MSSSDIAVEENFVSVFSSSNHDAEMEAMTINGILESEGIPAMIVGPQVLPNLEFQVQVPGHLAEAARRAVQEARVAGPAAADEGEAESER
jgi:butyrate kinase